MLRHAFTPIVIIFSVHGACLAAVPATQPTNEWIRLPASRWPQLVLTNEASFQGHSPLHGASAFLMRMPGGEIVVGTAKHLIKKPGGVDPPIPLAELDRILISWRVFPRTMENQAVAAKGVDERTNGEVQHDWLLLRINGTPAKLPSTPLVPRPDSVKVGETVYLVGVAYSDRQSAQNVYKGVVTARPKDHYFTYEFDPPVHIAGFSGAPIVDENGLLVGHGVSMSPDLKQKNGLEIEFGGEDASLALELWKHRNDPPTTRPADAVHLELPEGWTPKTPKFGTVLQFAEYPPLIAFIELVVEPKADFSDDTDLRKWASKIKAITARSTKLSNRAETELNAGNIGGRKTIEYEVAGENNGVKFRFRMIMLEVNGCFCKFACWTTPSHWEDAQPKFEEVVQRLR